MLTTLLQKAQETNFILACDSYKIGHIDQIPKTTLKGHSNIVPRKPFTTDEGIVIDRVVVSGPQIVAAILQSVKIEDWMINEAEEEITEQGYDFPREEWEYIRDLGYIPLEVRAIPEGTIVPVGLPIMTIENTDDRSAWLAGYIETWAQDIVWTMTTIASKIRILRQQAEQFCIDTGTPTDGIELEYMIHNFGDRGAKGSDAAILAGIAHLIFFSGTDCLRANQYIKKAFLAQGPVGSSVDAAEHATVCANSDLENKDDFGGFLMSLGMLERAVDRANRGIGIPVISCLIDTYDDERFVNEYIMGNYDKICEIGGKYVARPDSGDAIEKPIEVVKWMLEHVKEDNKDGLTPVNEATYAVLPPNLGVIQGDGLRFGDFARIFGRAKEEKLAASNFVFGFGGGMTNGSGRDDFSFSMKATARKDSELGWVEMQKMPKTDLGKTSMCGRVTVVKDKDDEYTVRQIKDIALTDEDQMQVIYTLGEATLFTFEQVRERARS